MVMYCEEPSWITGTLYKCASGMWFWGLKREWLHSLLKSSPVNSCAKICFLLWGRCSHDPVPASLVSCRPTHDQNPKILPVTPALEPGICLLGLPVSFLIIPYNWKNRRGHYLFPDPLPHCSKALKTLFIPSDFLLQLHLCLPEK